MSDQLSLGKERLQRVFSYIRELAKIRSKPTARLSDYDWSRALSKISKHPSISLTSATDVVSDKYDGTILRVPRLTETASPQPPSSIADWVEKGWQDHPGYVRILTSRNRTDSDGKVSTEAFSDNPQRKADLSLWTEKRNQWVEAEAPVREVNTLYHELFALDAKVRRESEKYQFYLGDGTLVWNSPAGPIEHPLLLRKVELITDPKVPECRIVESDDEPSLYSALLRTIEIQSKSISSIREKIEVEPINLLATDRVKALAKYVIQFLFANGRLAEESNHSPTGDPAIKCDPILFLGSGTHGFIEQLDKLIESIPKKENISNSLLRVVGIDDKNLSVKVEVGVESSPSRTDFEANQVIDFLLTKPANAQQEKIISRLESYGSVLVQGPPGTGKSHTIANIIGHCLAQGKTILVSSHTSKALNVVRDKVVGNLRPLCVSVLDNAAASKAQLHESVNGIVSYMSGTDSATLEVELSKLDTHRKELKSKIKETEERLLNARGDEYVDIVVAGEGVSPARAAKFISENEKEYGWVPLPVSPGVGLPLNEEEFAELYSSTGRLTKDEELCLGEGLPKPDAMPDPVVFSDLSRKLSVLESENLYQFAFCWSHDNQSSQAIDSLTTALQSAKSVMEEKSWTAKIFEDSQLGFTYVQAWTSLVEQVEGACRDISERQTLVYQHGPEVKVDDLSLLLRAADEIVSHVSEGRSLSFFSTFGKAHWRLLSESSKVRGKEPKSLEDFRAVRAHLEILQLRQELVGRWQRQVVPVGGDALPGEHPEKAALLQIDAVKFVITWQKGVWATIEADLKKLGFNFDLAVERLSASGKTKSKFELIMSLIKSVILPSLEERKKFIERESLRQTQSNLKSTVRIFSDKPVLSRVLIGPMSEAISSGDASHYSELHDIFKIISAKKALYDKRIYLLEKLGKHASVWANQIRERTAPHDQTSAPQGFETAWLVAQYRSELDRRHRVDFSKLQEDIRRLRTQLQEVNSQYVEKKAWLYQLRRTGLKEQQALIGWKDLQRRLTISGRGVRDHIIRRESQAMLRICKNSVPVWIMPLSKVYESYDLTDTKFDVLILDEASQADVSALVPFAIANEVIIVGDDEQNTPAAVGQNLTSVQGLIDEFLYDVPNRILYDGKTSIYHLASHSFGETIRLKEHFRCVPSIIEFSNGLSYHGEIQPLREEGSGQFDESLILHRVAAAKEENKINRIEANEIASLVAAMTEDSAYEKCSIGVISLLGDSQGPLIDSILQKRLDSKKYEKFKLLCGTSAHFQGDERDVVLLSMVHSCEDPPLAIKQAEDFKKSINVAASRARDQLWLVHSLNPSTDLKQGDLRLRLISHIEDPYSLKNEIERVQRKAESPFENEVIKFLINEGYRITPQWKVGSYRIDIVIEGFQQRIALECDGDKYHPAEKLAEDVSRQMVLERLGWRFIRIRGSEFYRNRTKAMARIFSELEALNIEKLGPHAEHVKRDVGAVRKRIITRATEIREEWDKLSAA